MKMHWRWLLITANLIVLVALAFIYPHLMLSPGSLVPEHASLATDCFACHAPLRGASADRCLICHALPEIGLRTSKGIAIKPAAIPGTNLLKTSFHQALTETNCMACHTDHAAPKLARRERPPFSHELLLAEIRPHCESCHAAPKNELHKNLSIGCTQCHRTEAWKPATFEHDKFFVLENPHNAPCATCHIANNYSKYTCYGCHEHTPAKVRRDHIEEGITNFENCVQCHRSADERSED